MADDRACCFLAGTVLEAAPHELVKRAPFRRGGPPKITS